MTKVYVDRYSDLWDHTVMRIKNAEKESMVDGKLDRDKFTRKMITRINKIKHLEKIHYAISVLIQYGYQDIAEIYDSRLVMELLAESL